MINIEPQENLHEANGNGLLLYQYYYSFYSQKVVFALHEKKIKFKTHLIDIKKGEQYQPWYLKLNPEMEVPVLKDGVKIIPDSARIIDYLEDNFSNGNLPHLLPEKGSEQWQKVKKFQDLLDDISASDLTFGAIFFPELCLNSKINSIEANARKQTFSLLDQKIKDLAILHPEFKEQYEKKRNKITAKALRVQNIENLQKLLEQLQNIFNLCEEELASHIDDKSTWWLCSESFTIADISLTMLLIRISHLGFYDRFISDTTRPYVKLYFQRVQQRDSYKAVLSQDVQLTDSDKCSCREHLVAVALGSTLILGIIIGAVIIYKRAK